MYIIPLGLLILYTEVVAKIVIMIRFGEPCLKGSTEFQ